MYSHGYNWREEPEGTSISSLVLLLVFIGAAAFLASMVYFRPWDDSPNVTPVTEVQVPPGSPAPEAAAPPAEGAPPPAQ